MGRTHTAAVSKALGQLRELRERLPSIGMETVGSAGEAMHPLDFIVLGIVKRCLSTTVAIELLVANWNMTCARAVLRMQLDTVLRFSAFWLSADPQTMASEVIGGAQINKMISKDGNRLTDLYLAQRLAEDFPWIHRVYRYTSGYIHFSERHLFDSISKLDDEKRITTFEVTEFDEKFPESSWLEIVECASKCLQITMHFLNGYKVAKAQDG